MWGDHSSSAEHLREEAALLREQAAKSENVLQQNARRLYDVFLESCSAQAHEMAARSAESARLARFGLVASAEADEEVRLNGAFTAGAGLPSKMLPPPVPSALGNVHDFADRALVAAWKPSISSTMEPSKAWSFPVEMSNVSPGPKVDNYVVSRLKVQGARRLVACLSMVVLGRLAVAVSQWCQICGAPLRPGGITTALMTRRADCEREVRLREVFNELSALSENSEVSQDGLRLERIEADYHTLSRRVNELRRGAAHGSGSSPSSASDTRKRFSEQAPTDMSVTPIAVWAGAGSPISASPPSSGSESKTWQVQHRLTHVLTGNTSQLSPVIGMSSAELAAVDTLSRDHSASSLGLALRDPGGAAPRRCTHACGAAGTPLALYVARALPMASRQTMQCVSSTAFRRRPADPGKAAHAAERLGACLSAAVRDCMAVAWARLAVQRGRMSLHPPPRVSSAAVDSPWSEAPRSMQRLTHVASRGNSQLSATIGMSLAEVAVLGANAGAHSPALPASPASPPCGPQASAGPGSAPKRRTAAGTSGPAAPVPSAQPPQRRTVAVTDGRAAHVTPLQSPQRRTVAVTSGRGASPGASTSSLWHSVTQQSDAPLDAVCAKQTAVTAKVRSADAAAGGQAARSTFCFSPTPATPNGRRRRMTAPATADTDLE